MQLVLDANILFAALIKEGTTRKIFMEKNFDYKKAYLVVIKNICFWDAQKTLFLSIYSEDWSSFLNPTKII